MELLKREKEIVEIFTQLSSKEEKYEKIISLGKLLPPFEAELRKETNLIKGCQSKLYLSFQVQEGRIFFQADSEALISKGLAALLIDLYSGHLPETILKHRPSFIEQLDLLSLLSMTRLNGFFEIHKRMQQIALQEIALRGL